MSTADPIIHRHDQYMTANYPRFPLAIASGQGATFTDTQGKVYTDLFSGFGAGILGHCHEDLVSAGTKQMNKLWHVGNLLHTEPQTQLAEQIANKGFGGRSFFCHSGADANEAAVKIARLYGKKNRGNATGEFGRYKVISTTQSFHGRSFATMGATGQEKVREGFGPLLPGFINVGYNDLDAVKAVLDDEAIAIIVEPIQGEGGVNVPEDGYLSALRKLCDERDMLLICDEVWTGCGRTGKYFAYQHWDITPDVLTLGKAVGCGMALGVCCVGERASDMFDTSVMGRVTHATTLGGNCVTTAVSARMFEVLERDGLVDRAATLGDQIKARLRKFGDKTGLIANVRGKGLFLGIDLVTDQAWFENGSQVVARALEAGLLINATQGNTLRIAPPLTIEEDLLDSGLSTLEDVLVGKTAEASA